MIRRKSIPVSVGKKLIGGTNPVLIQSMTDTPTADVEKTTTQIVQLIEAGAEMVRVTVNDPKAACATKLIRQKLDDKGYEKIPLVGDFHFIGHRLLKDHPDCVSALDKLRINPGNIGKGERKDENFSEFIRIARDNSKAVRIGVNAGSLDPYLLASKMDENRKKGFLLSDKEVENEALVDSAIFSAEQALELGLPEEKTVISCKVSNVSQMVACYREIAKKTNLALHLGLTEAGPGRKGEVSTTSALSILLAEGIGDTIRASLTPGVKDSRTNEVELCKSILQSLGIRTFAPEVTSCPGCGRTTSEEFRAMAAVIESHIDSKASDWRERYPGSEKLKVAVMGCVVNGPGESRSADIGISLPGTGETPRAPVYVDGEKKAVLRGEKITKEFIEILDNYVANRWKES